MMNPYKTFQQKMQQSMQNLENNKIEEYELEREKLEESIFVFKKDKLYAKIQDNLDFLNLKKDLQNIQELYLNLYPNYIEKISQIPHLHKVKELKHLLLESYEKNKRIFKREIQTDENNLQFDTQKSNCKLKKR